MSTLKADTIQSTSGGAVTLTSQEAAKASCNLDGSGTATIRASSNISSVTDNATGKYTHAFTNSFSDVNSITAGVVQISGSTITTTTNVAINTLQKVNFAKGVDGHPLAMNYYLQQ